MQEFNLGVGSHELSSWGVLGGGGGILITLLYFNIIALIALESFFLKVKIHNLFNRMQKLCEIIKLLHSIFKVFKVY